MIKKILIYLGIFVVFFPIFDHPARAASAPSIRDDTPAAIKLPVPQRPHERSYLGLSGTGHFKISQIKAPVVIVEVFSMYCPHCQKNAPEVNKLYRIIEDNPYVKDKIKLIGIGAGNSSYEVEIFRKKYDISFPLFADIDYSVHKALGEVRTPYFIGIKNNKDGTYKVFYSKLGGVEKADEFLEMMLKLSGLQ
ncbi:MAG: TlpA disulfide reductase family protein [Desulfovibrionales bacterium]|nr:TlpA disulfide reductase family protein [Desulfovibrionales bacterium]